MAEHSEIDVSIVIAARRAEKTLALCLDSCLAQTGVRTQIIVVVDNSFDNTLAVAKQYSLAHDQIKVLQTTRQGGPAAARNLGFAAAQGRWIGVVDADDTIEADRLETMLSDPSVPNAAILFDNMTILEKGRSRAFLNRPMPRQMTLKYFVDNNLTYISKPLLGYLKPLIKRDFLDMHRLSYNQALFNSEDYMLVLEILAAGGTITYVDHRGYNYYIHDDSISAAFNAKYNRDFIAAERDFMQRHALRLSDDEKKSIAKHIRYRALSEDIHNAIQALKQNNPRDFLAILLKRGLIDSYTILSVIVDIIFLKMIGAKSRI